MFHWAPPLVAGSGVRISRPACVRSAQSVIFLGLSWRTASATTDADTMPLYGLACQSCVISLALTSRVMSASSDKAAVCLETARNSPRLRTRSQIGFLEYHSLSCLVLPVFLEQRDDLFIGFTRSCVGAQNQGDVT